MIEVGARHEKLRAGHRSLCSTIELLYKSDPSFPKRRDSKTVKGAPRWTSRSVQEPGQGFVPVRYVSSEEVGCNAAVVSGRYNQVPGERPNDRSLTPDRGKCSFRRHLFSRVVGRGFNV